MMGHSPIRLCIVSDVFPPAYSGAGQQAFELAKRFLVRGGQVIVLTSQYEEMRNFHRIEKIAVHRVAKLRGSHSGILTFASSIANALVRYRHNYDIVHFFSAGRRIYLPLLVAKALGKRVVVTTSMLGDDDLAAIASARLGGLYLRILSLADAYVSNSPAVTAVSRSIAKDKIRLREIPYGVDTVRFSPPEIGEQRRRIRQLLEIPEDARVCLFVGAISRRKGVDLLLQAWPQVLETVPNGMLFLIGPTSWISISAEEARFCCEVEEVVAQGGLANTLRLVETDDVVPYLRAADLFSFPSRKEGLPNAVLEAMAVGVPLVVIRSNWVTDDFVRHNINGFIVEKDNPTLLARAITQMLQNEARPKEYGAASRELALNTFSLKARADEYWTLYQSLPQV